MCASMPLSTSSKRLYDGDIRGLPARAERLDAVPASVGIRLLVGAIGAAAIVESALPAAIPRVVRGLLREPHQRVRWIRTSATGRMVRMTNIPLAMGSPVPLREFVVSPGFAGAAAVIAALIVLCAVLYAGRRAGKRLKRGDRAA